MKVSIYYLRFFFNISLNTEDFSIVLIQKFQEKD